MSGPWHRIELRQGDITKVACDAIVNAANSALLGGGGGVDGWRFPRSVAVSMYPIAEAARIALSTTAAFLKDHREVQRVIFVLFGEQTLGAFRYEYDMLSEVV